MDKYTDNKFYPFLVLNPAQSKRNRRAMDDKEHIEVQHGVITRSWTSSSRRLMWSPPTPSSQLQDLREDGHRVQVK